MIIILIHTNAASEFGYRHKMHSFLTIADTELKVINAIKVKLLTLGVVV